MTGKYYVFIIHDVLRPCNEEKLLSNKLFINLVLNFSSMIKSKNISKMKLYGKDKVRQTNKYTADEY